MRRLRVWIILMVTAAVILSGCAGSVPAEPTSALQEQIETLPPETVPPTEPTEPPTEPTEPPTEPEPELDHEQIRAAIESIAQEYDPMGLQVAVVKDGKLAGSYAFGWATNKTDPMTTEHKIRIASLSKVVVGVAAMLLHEDGTMDIHGDIGQAWDMEIRNPNFPDVPITPYMILSHTSSIASYEVEPSTDNFSVRRRMPYAFWGVEPDTMSSWCYNNYAFRILGMTLELAADRTLDDILNERLFSVMDVEAAFAAGDLGTPELLTTLYNYRKVSRTVDTQSRLHSHEDPGGSGAYFAGSLTISAEDLAKIVAMLAADGMYEGQQLMKPETVELMQACTDTPTFRGTWQAHPLFHVPDLYGRDGLYFHTGYGYGVYSCLS